MKKSVVYMLILLCMCFSGCNDDGDDDVAVAESLTATSPDAVFKVFPDDYFTLGYQESYYLTGTDSDGYAYSVIYVRETDAPSSFNATTAVPINEYIQMTITNSGTFNFSDTIYFSTEETARQYLGADNETTCLPVTTYAFPQTVKIGDSGAIGTYNLSDGTSETLTYSVTDAKDGYVNLIISYAFTDTYGAPDGTEDHIYVIDQNGNRLALTIYTEDPDGYTMTLSGNRSN